MQYTVPDKLYRKIAWRLLPFLFLCNVVNFIDRLNISFAKLQFQGDLNINDAMFGIGTGIFFVGFILLEIPSNWLLVKIGMRKTLTRIMIAWGSLTMALMLMTGPYSFYAIRFLLGAAEAGFFPGVIFYLACWFPDRLRGRMTSLFTIAVPIAGVIGGPLATVIMTRFDNALGLRGWQWLFLIEGGAAVFLGVLAFFVSNNGPKDAGWLTPEEKDRVEADLAADAALHKKREHGFRAALHNPKVYLMSVVYFSTYMSISAINFWIPTILRQVGIAELTNIGLISGGIALVTAVATLVIGNLSDRTLARRWHVAMCGLTAAAGFLTLPLVTHSIAGTVVLLSIISAALYSGMTIFWTIPTAFLGGASAASGVAVITTLGAFGGVLSPVVIGSLKTYTGHFYAGFGAIGVTLIVGMLTLLAVVPNRPETEPSEGAALKNAAH